jgi:hypothetical protein
MYAEIPEKDVIERAGLELCVERSYAVIGAVAKHASRWEDLTLAVIPPCLDPSVWADARGFLRQLRQLRTLRVFAGDHTEYEDLGGYASMTLHLLSKAPELRVLEMLDNTYTYLPD